MVADAHLGRSPSELHGFVPTDAVRMDLADPANTQIFSKAQSGDLFRLRNVIAMKHTYDAPMLTESTSYYETVTRPYESKVIKALSANDKPITHVEMVKTALQICSNDQMLAALVLANFTKNMAAIER